MSISDISTKRFTGAGAMGIGRARLRQLQVTVGAGTGRFTVTDGAGGSTILDLDFQASDTHSVNIPSNGILSVNDPVVSVATNVTAFTVFFS